MGLHTFSQCHEARTFSLKPCSISRRGLVGGVVTGRFCRRALLALSQRLRRHSCSKRAYPSAAAAIPEVPEAQDRITVSVARDADGLAKVLSVLEVGSLAVAIMLQIQLLRREQAKLQAECRQDDAQSTEHVEMVMLHQNSLQRSPGFLVEGSVLALTLALALSMLGRLWKAVRNFQHETGASTSATGAARLLRLEVLSNRQAAALAAAQKELSKLQVRARVLAHDVQPPLRKVQGENAQQAEVLGRLAQRLESLDGQVHDTRDLLDALQGATMKQFQLVIQALEIAQETKRKMESTK